VSWRNAITHPSSSALSTLTGDEHWFAITEARLIGARRHLPGEVIHLHQGVLRELGAHAGGVTKSIGQTDQ
jgi:hypothetical protein